MCRWTSTSAAVKFDRGLGADAGRSGRPGVVEVHRSHEYGSGIIHSIETGIPRVINGNVPNRGLISNLPEGCCVEVPCLVDKNGVQPVAIGELPPHLAALMQTNINVQDLTVEAALTGKREHIYHAAMLDPHTAAELDLDQIWNLVDDLIEAHGDGCRPIRRGRERHARIVPALHCSVTVEQLIEDGQEVVVFDNLSQGHRAAVHSDAAFVQGDLADRDAIDEAMRLFAPDAIMHFASRTLVGESMQAPFLYLGENVRNGLNLLESAVRTACCASSSVHGEPVRRRSGFPSTRTRPLRWQSFGESKRSRSDAPPAGGKAGMRHGAALLNARA